jgi:hypothetical protein
MVATAQERKKITVISRYCQAEYGYSQWQELGQITGELDVINGHSRLLRSLSFGDEDYDACVAEVVSSICEKSPENIEIIIDHFDIDFWYKNKEPVKYSKVFENEISSSADFWSDSKLRVFISHLAKNKEKVSILSRKLSAWGIETFVAHEDIEPSREWMNEIEKALMSMDVLVAVVENGLLESKWCDQEIGFAMGRRIDIFPLRNGYDPYGFMSKYQGLQIKGRKPSEISEDLIKLFLKKRKLYSKLVSNFAQSLMKENSDTKISRIKLIFSWGNVGESDMKNLLESCSLNHDEKDELSDIIARVGAFKQSKDWMSDDDIPF